MAPYSGEIEVNGKSIRWQTSFDESVRFACVGCGYSCTSSNVELSKDEVLRIEGITHAPIAEPQGDGSLRIKGSDVAPCPLLTPQNKCSVYDARPSVCRLFPFKVVPISAHEVRIDVTYGCTAMLTKHFSEKNEVDYGAMVFEFLAHPFSQNQRYEGALLHAHVKERLDKDTAVAQCWSAIIGTIKTNDVFERLWDVLDAFEKQRDPAVLRKSHSQEYIDASLAHFSKNKSLVAPAYEKEFFFGAHTRPYQCLELATNTVYFFSLDEKGVRFGNRHFLFSEIVKKPLAPKAQEFLIEYLLGIWDRQLLRQKIEQRLLQSTQPSFSIQLDLAKKKFSLFAFFMDAIAHSRGHEQIELDDAREEVFPFDIIFCYGR